MTRATSTERLAALEQRLGDHEARCEERLADIKVSVGSTLSAVEGLKNRALALAGALLAWALAQLWSDNAHHFQRLESGTPIAAQEIGAERPDRQYRKDF